LELGIIELEGKVKIKNNRIYITSSYQDILDFKSKKKSIRDKFLERVDERIKDKDTRDLFKTFFLGESKDVLSLSLQANFYLTGLIHLLVVSGFHVGMLALFLRYTLPGKYGLYPSLIGISFYALFLVPLNPPVFRASLMIIFVILVKILNARQDILSILLFSVSLILLLNPDLVFSYSLWLSFFATLYIILSLRDFPSVNEISNPLKNFLHEEKLSKFVSSIFISFWVSIYAFLATSPLIATFSYNAPFSILFSPIVSLVILPFGFYGFLQLLTFLSLPIFPLEILTHAISHILGFLSSFSPLINLKTSLEFAVLLMLTNAVFLYFLKGFHKLIILLPYGLWFLVSLYNSSYANTGSL